jgi:serine/threonine protein phosphatase PrpC
MPVTASVQAAGGSHPGLLRASNEDRIHFDVDRGIYAVIDGVGGQAAGETAADTALAAIRERLEAGRGGPETRVRDAITAANNEIYRLASLRPDWKGMACVLTLAVVDDGTAVVGHVGDTRLYKLRRGGIEKLTRDHSPIGEREDAGELSEGEAMRHPRRNEVYRDVGSELHHADDPEFIDVFRVPFEPDAALLLCSDGLTDCVGSDAINTVVRGAAGHPYEVVRSLINSANDAGGKDNVSVVYVEGSRFVHEDDTRDLTKRARPATPRTAAQPAQPTGKRGRALQVALTFALLTAIGFALYAGQNRWRPLLRAQLQGLSGPIVVGAGESIAAAATDARPGTEVIVEPGEYRERLHLRTGVRIRSRVPRAAVIRLPAGAAEGDAAVAAIDVEDAELSGFRIVGDAATPLGTGVSLRNAHVNLVDLDVTGARVAAIEFAIGSRGSLLASEVHDNPGLAVLVRAGASPRIQSSSFARNATAGRTVSPLLIEAGATVELRNNIFRGIAPSMLLGPGAPPSVAIDNSFPDPPATVPAPPRPSPRGRR